ncbi:peptide-methionine (S)-S-oxide reductase MsrA [Methyloceanibacter sp.]|uniref:peptide-methionine (S)-S-oxide reductase MsrA n=1 Tax=Methyloceanibacter sp. TaxID=1965321 RepID=UPI002081FA86|nr:peptide-methionine (S)-S-oxide reductase MsrA [Methyloceanibacter sp.]GFO81142.1 MAG: peptide methionine sulfoxide reductase MsrA [Methyloceanibacter sp.]HML91449.1 peptide-methionine (S)-S-oxide reductase MsrA [Methyloceanibacter sp.]
MIARWIFAGLTAAFLTLFVFAANNHGARAEDASVTKTAIFAGGCFWCVEDAFDKVDGVTDTVSGYAGGTAPDPTYGSHEGYVEALKVTYDPSKVTYAQLLDNYWHNIDPFDPTGQFCDKGPAYRTVVFVSDDAEKSLAEKTKQDIAERFGQDVATQIRPTTTFYAAEDYHQDYHTKNPISYKYYKWNCGRAQRLSEIWGDKHG